MKFHVKSSLIFIMITVILLLGITALSAVNVDDGNQTSIEQKVVSDTTSVQVTRDVEETVSNTKTNEIKKENYEKEQTNTNTNNKIETDTTHSKDIKQTPSGPSNPRYIYVTPHYVGTKENPTGYSSQGYPIGSNRRLGSAQGTINDPTDLYTAFSRVQDNPGSYDVIYMMANGTGEAVYESEEQAVYLDVNKNVNIILMGEPGKTIVMSGKNWTSNMLSVSIGNTVTVQNVVFRDGNASGIQRGADSWLRTADVGGAIDNRGTLHVINCTFERIIANQYGGAIANYDNAVATIEDCNFRYINSTNITNIESQPINLAYGGAISATNTNGFTPQVTVKNSNFTNVTGENGAVILNNGGNYNIENVNIVNATATVEGGAIINQGDMTIKNMNVSNVSSRRYGGVIANHGTANIDGLNVHNSTIVYDENVDYDAEQYGGTIYNEGELTIKNSQLDNLTSAWGGVFSNNEGTLEVDNVTAFDVYASYNGGLLVNYNDGTTIITNSNFTNINASLEAPYGNAAGIFLETGNVNFINNNLSDCNSRGSAIAYNFFGELNLNGNNFTNNHVNGDDNYLIMAPMEEYGMTITTIDDNNFVNNTNLYYGEDNDALFYDVMSSATGNTYKDNTLSYNITITPQGGQSRLIDHTGDNLDFNVTLNGTSNETDIAFNIREAYLTSGVDKYINGTLQVFLNDEPLTEDPITVSDSDVKITIPVTGFAKYDNDMTIKFTSANNDFIDSEYKFKVYKVLSTNVTVNNVEEKIPIGNSFTVEGVLYALEGKYAGDMPGVNVKPGLKADPVEITQVPIEGATVTITVEDDSKVYHATTGADGSYSATINDEDTISSVGIKKITVKYDGEYDHYNADDDTAEVEIVKREVTVTLDDISDVTVRETAHIAGTVVDTEDPTKPVTSGKVIITITDENGTEIKQVEVPVGADGTYSYDYPTDTTIVNTVSVEFVDEDNKYEQVEQTEPKDFNVNQLASKITVNVNATEVFVGDEVTITGTLTEAVDTTKPIGDVDISVNIGLDEPIPVHVNSDGTFTIEHVVIDATTDYHITAVYDGNNTYVGDDDSKDIEVKIRPIPTQLTITSSDVSINETNIINLEVTDNEGNPIDGIVTLSVDGRFEDVEITNGQGVFEYKNTPIGKNVTISGYFVEDTTRGYLRSSTESTEFEVLKIGTELDITTTDDVTAHKEAIATITLTNTTVDEEGVEVTKPIAGEVINVEISDEYGNILASNIEAITDANGQVEVKFIPVSGGDITITAIHQETDVYTRADATEPVSPILSIGTVTTITATNTTINGTSIITVTVTDEEGNPVKGQVQLTIDGQEVPVTIETDENGIATYECGPADAYAPTTGYKEVTVSAKYLENETNGYKESESQPTTFTVDRLNTTIEIATEPSIKAHNKTNATITLSNSTGHLAANEPVTVIVTQGGEVIYNATEVPQTTDANGQVKIEFTPINTEDIEITVNYAENEVYNANSATKILTNIKSMKTTLEITSENVAINETAEVTITVTDELDQPVNGTVLLLVDGNFVEVEVINGEAIYDYTNTHEGKNVTISGYFKEDEENGYKQSNTDSTTFEVEKLPIAVDVEVDTTPLTAHEDAVATITLTDPETGDIIPGEEVNVVIRDGDEIIAKVTATADENGQVFVDFVPESGEDITIVVEHPESSAYQYADNKDTEGNYDTFAVGPLTVNVELTTEPTIINGTSPVVVKVTDEDGNPVEGVPVELTLDDGSGEPVVVTVITDENGIATYPYDDTEEAKTVTVTAEVTDDSYEPKSDVPITDTFDVDRLDVNIDIIPEEDVIAGIPTSADISIATEDDIVPVGEKVKVTITQDGVDDPLYEDEVEIDEDGVITIPFTPENAEDITISVTFDETDQFNANSDSETVTVDTKDTVIEIVPESPVTAHKETSATITLSSEGVVLPNQKLEVTVTQNGNPIPIKQPSDDLITDENGNLVIDFTPINTDDVLITVKYEGDDVYNPSENSAIIGNIRPIDTVMTITADDVSIYAK